MTKFERDQLILVVQSAMHAAFDVIHGLLPPVNDRKTCNKNEVEYKGIIHGAKQTVAHFCPFIYANLTNDGMSIAEFPGWNEFESRVDKYVSDCLGFTPPDTYPNCEDIATEFVDGVFSEYYEKQMNPIIDSDGTKKWYNEQGLLHRDDGPAVECSNGTKKWFQNGKLHREDGPAVEEPNGTKEWWVNGKPHREDGPACEYPDGNVAWYLNGEFVKSQNS